MKIDNFNVGTSQSENKSENPNNWLFRTTLTAQKVKFSIRNFFSKCDQIRSFLRIWSHLLKKFLMENFIFCAVNLIYHQKQSRFS